MNDFDLTGLSLEDFGDSDSSPDMKVSDEVLALQEVLGIEDLDLDLDLDDGMGDLNLDTGTNLILDFEDEEDNLSAGVLFNAPVDISRTFVEYYNSVRDAWVKVKSTFQHTEIKTSNPPITEFCALYYDKAQIPIVYRYFCATLNDLTTREEHRDKTVDEAYQYLLEAMYNDIHFTPNIYEEKFHRIFCQYYEKNKKLSGVKTKIPRGTIGSIVDVNKIELALSVYGINSQPFDAVSKFLNDVNLVDPRRVYKIKDLEGFGDFAETLKNQYGTRNGVYFKDVFKEIITFLSSDEVLKVLQLPEESRADFSTGELLRRYIVYEFNSGDLFPKGFKGLNSQVYSEAYITKVITNLMPLCQYSISAEIIYFLADMMLSSPSRDARDDYFKPFIMGMAQFFSAAIEDRALINPVFYGYIGLHTDNATDSDKYELGYTEGEQSFSVVSQDILCDVVGDSVGVLCVPTVYVGNQSANAICPPVEVFKSVQKVASSGRLMVDGNVAYRYTPSYSWITTLDISSSKEEKKEAFTPEVIGETDNPLLNVLLHYDNDFDMSGVPPKVMSIDIKDVGHLLGVQVAGSDTVPVLSLRFYDGSPAITNGTCAIDQSDDSLIIRYMSPSTGSEDVAFYDSDSFEVIAVDDVQDNGAKMPSVSEIIDCKPYVNGFDDESYLGAVAKRICDLNALDYSAELEHARQVIIRDLERVVDVTFIDRILGYRMLGDYLNLLSKGQELGSFNFGFLKEILGFVFGEPNCLTDLNDLTPEAIKELQRQYEEYHDGTVEAFIESLDMFDPQILAMQALSRSELSDGGDKQLYNVARCIPEVNARLRTLENMMVLLSALREVGDDIAPVLKKMSSMYTAYNTVCTKDTINRVESNLVSGIKKNIKSGVKKNFKSEIGVPESSSCLKVTRRVLTENAQESVVILKYFILERNPYGVLTQLEECFERGSQKHYQLYLDFKEALGVSDIEKVTDLSAEEFHARVPESAVGQAFSSLHKEFLSIIDEGLVAEVSSEVNLQVIKAYDMLVAYGRYMFNLQEKDIEDFSNVDLLVKDFYSYIGSFTLTYCPVFGEACGEVDGGSDRVTAYLRHRDDFKANIQLSDFEQFPLRDLKLVVGVQEEDDEETTGK